MACACILAVFLILGCGAPQPAFTCPDGTNVSFESQCQRHVNVTDANIIRMLAECDNVLEAEDRSACYTGIAVQYKDLSVCDKLPDKVWHRFCYDKLNMSWLLGPEPTTTLRQAVVSTIVTTTSTTTTLACGNGLRDLGEECDVGLLCNGSTAVCAITAQAPRMAVCMEEGKCDWNTQTGVSVGFDLGACIGCHAPGTTDQCKCLKPSTLNLSTTQGAGSGGVTPSTLGLVYHRECYDGNCMKISGKGTDQCLDTSDCRHSECQGLTCYLLFSPGTSTCGSNVDCEPDP